MKIAGKETVLVVDDEPGVRRVIAELLREAGYEVLTAASGREALQIYAGQAQRIRLALVDLLMPELGGHSLIQSLVRYNPGIKVLVVSAASPEGPLEDALQAGAYAFLAKPFDPQQLLRTVQEILAE